MSYVVFVPRRFHPGGPPADVLPAVGLPDFVLGADAVSIPNGPGGEPGSLFSWGRRPIGFEVDAHDWVPAADPDASQRGRYLLGFRKGQPVEVGELEREYAYGGRPVPLGDGETWLVPRPGDLGLDAKLADDGSWRFFLQREYHRYGVECGRWRARAADGSIVRATLDELARFAYSALRLNYRVTPEAVSHLALLDSENVKDLFFAAVGRGE